MRGEMSAVFIRTRAWLFALLAASMTLPVAAQEGAAEGEWRHYAGDRGSTKYSPLDQIDRHNFSELEVAWRWESADAGMGKADTACPSPS